MAEGNFVYRGGPGNSALLFGSCFICSILVAPFRKAMWIDPFRVAASGNIVRLVKVGRGHHSTRYRVVQSSILVAFSPIRVGRISVWIWGIVRVLGVARSIIIVGAMDQTRRAGIA